MTILTVARAAAIFFKGISEGLARTARGGQRHAGDIPAIRYYATDTEAEVDEFVIVERDPAEAIAIIRRHAPTPYHYLAAIGPNRAALVAAYLALGYREEMHETLMARALCDISPPDQAVPIVRVTSAEQADRLNATHVRQVIAQHELGDPAVRQYMIELDDQPAAWGRFVAIDSGAIYITSIRTAERYRRRGLARALMLRLMRDASEAGFTISVLAASEMGVALYQTLGYVELAALVVFVPKETAQPT